MARCWQGVHGRRHKAKKENVVRAWGSAPLLPTWQPHAVQRQFTPEGNLNRRVEKQNGKKELDARKRKEVNRLKKLIKALEDRSKLLLPTIENVAWMCVKLEEASDAIATSDVAIPYDNGGGQKGIRQNPHFQGYESLWKSYILGMMQIMGTVGAQKDAKSEKLRPTSVIQLVRSRKEA
nr:MAG TPA: terminase small subunit [Caudoviricetes sp.]